MAGVFSASPQAAGRGDRIDRCRAGRRPMAMERPAAVACAAPQAPSARPCPALPCAGRVIAAIRVETANKPAAEADQAGADERRCRLNCIGAAKITVENAHDPGQNAECRPDGTDCDPWPASRPASANPGRRPRPRVLSASVVARHRQSKDFTAIGFQQHVLHVEGHGADKDARPAAGRPARRPSDRPRHRGTADAARRVPRGSSGGPVPVSTGRSCSERCRQRPRPAPRGSAGGCRNRASSQPMITDDRPMPTRNMT